jgi:hypothetical protein
MNVRMDGRVYEKYIFRQTVKYAEFASFLKIAMKRQTLKGIADE